MTSLGIELEAAIASPLSWSVGSPAWPQNINSVSIINCPLKTGST